MAQPVSHSHACSSTASLPTLSRKASGRAAMLQQLVDSLRMHDPDDRDGDARMLAVFDELLNGGSSTEAR